MCPSGHLLPLSEYGFPPPKEKLQSFPNHPIEQFKDRQDAYSNKLITDHRPLSGLDVMDQPTCHFSWTHLWALSFQVSGSQGSMQGWVLVSPQVLTAPLTHRENLWDVFHEEKFILFRGKLIIQRCPSSFIDVNTLFLLWRGDGRRVIVFAVYSLKLVNLGHFHHFEDTLLVVTS